MRYMIESVQVQMRNADGEQFQVSLNRDVLGEDCHMVLIGSDAYGAAGTHEKLPGPGPVPVPIGPSGEEITRESSVERPRTRGRQDAQTESRSYAMTAETDSLERKLPTCIYRNGKWYCW